MTDDEALLEEPLPTRRRGKILTSTGAVLAAVLIAASGFFAGVQVQKAQSDDTGTRALPGGFAGAPGRGANLPGGREQTGGGGATVGEVSSVDGSTFYVEDANGNTIRVRAGEKAKVSRNAVADADEIHPGDTVVVQGRTADSGTVVATTVSATASNAESSAGPFGFGRGAGAPGGVPPGGTPGGG
jgi:Domain of unknown function (DUF5666)